MNFEVLASHYRLHSDELHSKWMNGTHTLADKLSKNLLWNFRLRAVPWYVRWVDSVTAIIVLIWTVQGSIYTPSLRPNIWSQNQWKYFLLVSKMDFCFFILNSKRNKNKRRFLEHKWKFFKTKNFQTWTLAENPKSARIPSNSK